MATTMFRCPCCVAQYVGMTPCVLHQIDAGHVGQPIPVGVSADCPHAWPDTTPCPQCTATVIAAVRGQVERVA